MIRVYDRYRWLRSAALCGAIAFGVAPAVGAEEEPPTVASEAPAVEQAPAKTKLPRSLSLVARERLLVRSAEGSWGGESDTDGHIFVAANATSDSGALVGDLALSIWSDLDGIPRGEATVFGSLQDTPRSSTSVEVLSLWVGYETDGMLDEARVGRQVIEHGSPVALDGLSLTLDLYEPWLSLFAFGGRTVHFFNLHPERLEDWIVSAGVTLRPFKDLRLEVDYRFMREATADQEEIIDNSYGIAAWYRPSDWLQLRGYLRGVDDALSRVGAAARVTWPGMDVGVEAKVHAQPMALDELNVRDDPYFSILGQSDPFLRWKVDGWAGIETTLGTFALHLGGNGRHLFDDLESPFNRNLGRLYVLGTAHDLFVPGLYLSVAFERHSDDFDFEGHGVWAVAGAAGYEGKGWRAEIGSSYNQYKYTYYQSVDELEDVRSFYGDGRLQLLSWLTVRARYQLELLAWTHHTVTISMVQEY